MMGRRRSSWPPRVQTWHLQPQPSRRGLEEQKIAVSPLVPAEQRGCLGWRHPDSRTDPGWRRDAPIV
jgi:hypothetical protein